MMGTLKLRACIGSAFPTNLDSFTNPGPDTPLNASAELRHDRQHVQINDAVKALQAKVGIDSSADTDSLDYKTNHREVGIGFTQTEWAANTVDEWTNEDWADVMATTEWELEVALGPLDTKLMASVFFYGYMGSGDGINCRLALYPQPSGDAIIGQGLIYVRYPVANGGYGCYVLNDVFTGLTPGTTYILRLQSKVVESGCDGVVATPSFTGIPLP